MSNLLSKSDTFRLKQGKVLFLAGERSDYLYIIKSGEIRLFDDRDGTLRPVAILEEKNFVEDETLFRGNKTQYIAIAAKDSELVKIKKSEIQEVLGECPEWMTNIMLALTDRLNNTMNMLSDHNIGPSEDSKLFIPRPLLQKYLASIEDYKQHKRFF